MFEKSSDLAYLVLNFSSYSLKGSFLCLECKQRNMNEKLLTGNTTCSGKGFSEKVISSYGEPLAMHAYIIANKCMMVGIAPSTSKRVKVK